MISYDEAITPHLFAVASRRMVTPFSAVRSGPWGEERIGALDNERYRRFALRVKQQRPVPVVDRLRPATARQEKISLQDEGQPHHQALVFVGRNPFLFKPLFGPDRHPVKFPQAFLFKFVFTGEIAPNIELFRIKAGDISIKGEPP